MTSRHILDGIRSTDFVGSPAPNLRVASDDESAPLKRNIPAGHEFNPKVLKPLAKMLWAMSVSLGHALTAYREFSRVKSVTISPDGLLGGRGYVMSVKEIRSKLYEACEALSAISDTVHDEVHAPYWHPQELPDDVQEDVEKFIGEAEHNLEDPDETVDEEMSEVEKQPKRKMPKTKKIKDRLPDTSGASALPGYPEGGEADPGKNPMSPDRPEMQKQASYDRRAESSVSPDSLPGPRVTRWERGEQVGPGGSSNVGEPQVQDAWGQTDGVSNEYRYPSDWANNFSHTAESSMPNDPNTRTEAQDFGIGYGNGNDAHGQGSCGYAVDNPHSGPYGAYGPKAELPEDDAGATQDLAHSDTTPAIESHSVLRMSSTLPGDGEPGVARRDYYRGPKSGNDFDVITSSPVQAAGALPGDESDSYDYDRDMPNTGYTSEHADQALVKWDDSTRNMRFDPVFQRDPTQGPYAK